MKKNLLLAFALVLSTTAFAMAQGITRSNFRFFPSLGASSVIASAATIAPTAGVAHISGTVAIATITVPPGCNPTCTLSLVPDGLFTTTATGNISLASTAVVNKVLIMVWDGTKWNPSY